jgi:LacI family transcriptional regulator
MTGQKVRLSDVAIAAGTSIKTVSRVINGDPWVSPETRTRVQAEVDRLGYRVDVMARSLRKGVDETVGVIVPTIGDPFFATMIEEVERIALEQNLNVFIASNSRTPSTERRVVEGMLARRVAGLIIAPFMTDFGFLAHINTPVVFLDRHPNGLDSEVVLVDDFAEARKAVKHLASHGHTRIALIVDDLEIETSRKRREGYLAAHVELGLPIDESLQYFDCSSAHKAEASTYKILEHRNAPTAIFSTRTETSLGVVRALHLGKRTDIAMVSFGDFVAADILSPAITVLDHNPRILARIAMKRLVVLMSGEKQESQGDTIVPLSIIARGSGELSAAVLEVSA